MKKAVVEAAKMAAPYALRGLGWIVGVLRARRQGKKPARVAPPTWSEHLRREMDAEIKKHDVN